MRGVLARLGAPRGAACRAQEDSGKCERGFEYSLTWNGREHEGMACVLPEGAADVKNYPGPSAADSNALTAAKIEGYTVLEMQ